MNRLSPLVARRARALSPSPTFEPFEDEAAASQLFDDVKLFAYTWLAGLIFFGTYLS